jgi:rhodanese-related sulfurtransferase
MQRERNTGLNHILGLVMPADRAATGNESPLRYGPVGLGELAMTAFPSRLFRPPRGDAPAWIEVDELQRRLAAGDAIVLVDVRQPEEFTAPPGYLPGAVNVPLADLSGRAGELAARRQPVVVVCKTDRRSARAATELLAGGSWDVAVLRGGTDGWHRQGLGLE